MKLTSKQIKRLKKSLQLKKQQLEHQLEQEHGIGDSMSEMTSELSTYDNHPADLGTVMFERSKDISLNEMREIELHDVNEAIERIDAGQYGQCVVCHQSIPYKRLEAIPETRYCLQHAPSHFKRNYPVEEEVLSPPFVQNSYDHDEQETEFDAEDSWQIVENWGTSTSDMTLNALRDDDENWIEVEEKSGYVEDLESFLATDITGQHRMVVRNQMYHDYMQNNEGDHKLNIYDPPPNHEC